MRCNGSNVNSRNNSIPFADQTELPNFEEHELDNNNKIVTRHNLLNQQNHKIPTISATQPEASVATLTAAAVAATSAVAPIATTTILSNNLHDTSL